MKILGVTLVYNEADCIVTAIRMLQRCCDHVIVFDHGSTDSTPQIIGTMPGVERIVLSRTEWPSVDNEGVQSWLPWQHVAKLILEKSLDYDWVVWMDADEILRMPNGTLPCKLDLEREADSGIQVIRPLIRHYFMTEKDDKTLGYLQAMRHCVSRPKGHAPRAWQLDLTPKDIPPGRHIQDLSTGSIFHPFYATWPIGTVVSNNKWLLEHYPFRSQEQATRKILKDRNWITPLNKRKYGNYICGRGHRVAVTKPSSRLVYIKDKLEMP